MEWLKKCSMYLSETMVHEQPSQEPGSSCTHCSSSQDQVFRCLDCFGLAMKCVWCIISTHQLLLLHCLKGELDHFISILTHIMFQFCSDLEQEVLWSHISQGTRIGDLSRSSRGMCPNAIAGPSEFLALDTNGMHNVDVQFCGCVFAPKRAVQLLRIGWYPTSTKWPKYVAIFSLLKTFDIIQMQSKISAYDTYASLEHLTDNTSTEELSVSYP